MCVQHVLASLRQKAAESLCSLLNNDAVKDFIDNSSTGQRVRGRSSSSLVTWDGLFAAVASYVFRECENILKLEREKPVISATTQTGRKKMKQVRRRGRRIEHV